MSWLSHRSRSSIKGKPSRIKCDIVAERQSPDTEYEIKSVKNTRAHIRKTFHNNSMIYQAPLCANTQFIPSSIFSKPSFACTIGPKWLGFQIKMFELRQSEEVGLDLFIINLGRLAQYCTMSTSLCKAIGKRW
jgi:hypothetical protein